jgi:hypothetical protein
MVLASLRRLIAARQLAWLLAFALWLPLAQWLAATHALLHLHASVAEEADRPAHLPESCDTCVVAATLAGAAPAVDCPAVLPRRGARVQPLAPAPGELPQSHRAGYRSRAPPFLHA